MNEDQLEDDPAIDPGSRIHPRARLDPSVRVGAFAVIGDQVVIGAGTVLAEHVVIRPRAILGADCQVDSFAVLGGEPQMAGFDPSLATRVELGNRVKIRESVTIHRSTKAGGATIVGDDVFIMAGGHIAHDCQVGDRCTLANNVLLAGHVEVQPDVMLGGGAGVHQFSRIGRGAMLAGNCTVTQDVPPFCMVVERNGLIGLNKVGLRRRGVQEEEMSLLKRCYRTVYRQGADPRAAAAAALAEGLAADSDLAREFLSFFAGGTRGFVRPRRRPDVGSA